jgi:hypothetical protein
VPRNRRDGHARVQCRGARPDRDPRGVSESDPRAARRRPDTAGVEPAQPAHRRLSLDQRGRRRPQRRGRPDLLVRPRLPARSPELGRRPPRRDGLARDPRDAFAGRRVRPYARRPRRHAHEACTRLRACRRRHAPPALPLRARAAHARRGRAVAALRAALRRSALRHDPAHDLLGRRSAQPVARRLRLRGVRALEGRDRRSRRDSARHAGVRRQALRAAQLGGRPRVRRLRRRQHRLRGRGVDAPARSSRVDQLARRRRASRARRGAALASTARAASRT